VQRSIGQLDQIRQRLATAAGNQLSDASHRVALLGRALHSVSPLATLDRGYAIVKREDSDAVLMDTAGVNKGDDVRTRLARGEFTATVKKVHR
jgi:exodeoxyribonuclease VII large subunit